MRSAKRALFAGLAMFGVVAFSATADDLSQKAVNDPGSFWSVWGVAKANYVAAPNLKGGAAQRVTISNPGKPWDAGTFAAIKKPVKKGDVLVLMFWARAAKPPPGSDLIMVTGRIYEAGTAGNGVSPETSFLIGAQWKLYNTVGTATKDYPAGGLSAGMVLGTGDQVIEFSPISILDFGPGYDVNNLPRS